MDKENNKGIRRGEIFWYDFGEQDGSVQKGYRPVIVLQDNIINSYSDTVIVAPLTGVIKKPYWFSHLLIGKKFGLSLPSMILMAPSWQALAHRPQPLHFSSSIWMIFLIMRCSPPQTSLLARGSHAMGWWARSALQFQQICYRGGQCSVLA